MSADASPETASRFDELIDAIAHLRDPEVVRAFLRDLCTTTGSMPWDSDSRSLDWSTRACPTKRSHDAPARRRPRSRAWPSGYTTAKVDTAPCSREDDDDPSTNHGPSVEGSTGDPSWLLLEASGVAPQEAGERMLQGHCRNADIDLLFVRADDVPEYVQDGVVDCGITGLDLINERECNVDVLLRLGFGACSLQAAVSNEDDAREIEDFEGRRIATSHPRIAAKALPSAASAPRSSRWRVVEISPRLGLADAIIDLVSTGSTLRTNGLRSIGVLFESEAVLVGSGERQGLRGAPDSHDGPRVRDQRAGQPVPLVQCAQVSLAEVTAILPTLGSPTVMDLATPGVVAVHALVPAADIWSLLPRLEMAGASSTDSARRADGPVSTPVKTNVNFTIDDIGTPFASAGTTRSSSGHIFFPREKLKCKSLLPQRHREHGESRATGRRLS